VEARNTITKSSRRGVAPSPADAARDPCGEVKTLIDTLRLAHGIDIANADKATRARYKSFTGHHPVLHPACALWFAKQCLVAGDKGLLCEVVNTFKLTRLQGIVEGAGIVTSGLKNLPHVHQIEFAAGCELTAECIAELVGALKERRTAPFELDLHGCIASCDALLSLSLALPGLRGLAMLSISDPDVPEDPHDRDWITALAVGLAGNAELLAFKLGVPDLTPEQAKAMGRGLRGCRSLNELHLNSENLASLTGLLGSLGEMDPPDPDSPGTAARSLATVRIVGRPDPQQPKQRPFPPGSVRSLSQLVARYPSLRCIHISPSMDVESFDEFEDVMALCGSAWKDIEVDVDFSLATDGSAKTKSGELIERETGRVLNRSAAYIQRKEASHRLLSGTEFRDVACRLLASVLEGKFLPNDVISEIVLLLAADRSSPGSALMTLNNLSRINSKTAGLGSPTTLLRSAHFERLKGLMTFSAFAFGISEFADPLCFKLSSKLRKGRLFKKDEEKALKSLITGRPDSDALEKSIREAEIHQWQVRQAQVRLLLLCGFKDEFLAEQKVRWKFQTHSKEFGVTLEDKRLEGEANEIRFKKAKKKTAKTVLNLPKFFKPPSKKRD
jgi:hypothetical protein